MSTKIDPYLQWLGIRDPQRPPNHYRLLGLELFESDANIIAMSADRQMSHLRNFKSGPDADLAEQLLNELSAARVCLLKPERKAAYDTQIRSALQPAVAPQKKAPTAAPLDVPRISPAPLPRASAGSSVKPVPKISWKPWAALAGLVMVCVALTIILIKNNPPREGESLASGETSATESRNPNLKKKPTPSEDTPVTVKAPIDPGSAKPEPPKKASPSDNEKAVGSNNKKQPAKELPTVANVPTVPVVDVTALLGEQVDAKNAPKTPDIKDTKNEDSNIPDAKKHDIPDVKKPEPTLVVAAVPPPDLPKQPTRIAIPDKAALTAKEKEIRVVFADEYKSQQPEVKTALAAKLRQSSIESKDDAVMRYVLLTEARNNAVYGGAVKVAVEITEELVRDYDVSGNDERFTLFSKLLAGANRNAAYGQLVLEELRKSLTQLQENDEYDVALKLINVALAAARNLRDPALVTELTQWAKELNLQKASYQRAKIAKENLTKNPNDPAANELWGSYLSFTKGEFNSGLPFLARGTSADLSSLAERELAAKQTPSEQLDLANDWWSYGEKLQTQDAVRFVNIRKHAGAKYLELLPKLTSIDKAKAEKRIAELAKISDQKNKRDIDQMISILVNNKWQLYNGNDDKTAPEEMTFRADGTMTHRVFNAWAIENSELVLRTGIYMGKVKFNFTEFELEYYLNGKFSWKAKAKILR